MLILSRTEVESLLDLDRLVDAVSAAMVDLSARRVSMPCRVAALGLELAPDDAALVAFRGEAKAGMGDAEGPPGRLPPRPRAQPGRHRSAL